MDGPRDNQIEGIDQGESTKGGLEISLPKHRGDRYMHERGIARGFQQAREEKPAAVAENPHADRALAPGASGRAASKKSKRRGIDWSPSTRPRLSRISILSKRQETSSKRFVS